MLPASLALSVNMLIALLILLCKYARVSDSAKGRPSPVGHDLSMFPKVSENTFNVFYTLIDTLEVKILLFLRLLLLHPRYLT